MTDFDGFFLFWSVRNVKVDIMVNEKMARLNAKCVQKNAHILRHSFLHRSFKDKSVISSVPNDFNNTETPIICYKYYKTIPDQKRNAPLRFSH